MYSGINSLKDYVEDSLNFILTNNYSRKWSSASLMYLIILIIVLFLLKNIFYYLGLFFMTFLKNGMLRDIRDEVYFKIITLPISYYSEKKKGDIIARI